MGYFMSTLAKQVIDAGFADRIFTERRLAELLGGSDARRYGLVNRALKNGSLIRIKRGVYMLNAQYRGGETHPFAAAQTLVPGSYVSFETALSYHGWIPEAVFAVASVSPGRKTVEYDCDTLGWFTFHPLALRNYRFLVSVKRRKMGKLAALVAQPLRALMDIVALRKKRWSGLDWVQHSLRVDDSHLITLRRKDFMALAAVYKHKATNEFLEAFENAVIDLKSSTRTSATYRREGAE